MLAALMSGCFWFCTSYMTVGQHSIPSNPTLSWPMKARQRGLARCSAIVGAFGVGLLLWPWRDLKHGLTFFSAGEWSRAELQNPQLLRESFEQVCSKWDRLPWTAKSKIYTDFYKMNEEFSRGFSVSLLGTFFTSPTCWTWEARCDFDLLVAACRHALGNDVIVEMVGSLIRDTGSAYAPDMDLQVRRRPGSDRADALFTETDKCKVAQNLEKLRCVKLPVTIGNVAITFTMHGSPVDLVLANPRSEDFPKLRGGENFYENSAQINRFLDQMPLARAVILGIKQFFSDGRPKGILLDAIVWRLSTTYRGRLSTALRDDDFSKDFNSFFDYVVFALKDWEESPFGSDFKKDLDKLPERKRDEYLQGFERFRTISALDIEFRHLLLGIHSKALREWTPDHGPFDSFLERMTWEFFPFTKIEYID